MAPVHVLVVPRAHVASLDELEDLPGETRAACSRSSPPGARRPAWPRVGYRVVTNTGPDAGQEVMHLHWHVIGGRRLGGMA